MAFANSDSWRVTGTPPKWGQRAATADRQGLKRPQ